MKFMRFLAHSTAFAASLGAVVSAAHAAYPDRAITMVVPYAPGGAADALARVVAARMSEKLGASVIIDNRAGASGTIGAAFVAKALPDGYTVLYDATPFTINPHLYHKLPFSTDALQPVSLVALAPNILIVKGDSPLNSTKDLIAKAKAEPGKLNFASGGSGTVQRLAGELFRQKLNLNMVHVSYKSGGPAIVDVMGGQVDFMFSTISASFPLVASGKLKAIAVSSPERSKLLPNVPTVAESGIPGYEAFEWNGVMVPKGTPEPIQAKLQKVIADVLKEDAVKKRFSELGAQPVGSTSADFAAFLKKEDAKWADVIRKGNIKLD